MDINLEQSHLNYDLVNDNPIDYNATINIKIIDPIRAGKIGTPPNIGPHCPKRLLPIVEPIKPAIIFPIMPNGTSFPRIAPASQPINPPTINMIINPMMYSPFLSIII